MNILLLLFLAQAPYVTAFTEPDRKVPNAYQTTYYFPPEMAERFYTPSQELINSTRQGIASQTGGDPDTGIRTLPPRNWSDDYSLEQKLQMEEIESQRLARDVNTRGSLLNQRINDAEHRYKLSTIEQSEQFLDRMKDLDPRSPDYITSRADLISKYPLAAQNDSITRNLGLLDRTHEQIGQNDLILNRQRELAKEAERERDINQGRTLAAKFGSRALAQYEEMLAKDPQNPLGVIANMVDAQEQQNTISTLKRIGVDERQFYVPEIGAGGTPTGRKIFDVGQAEDFIKTAPTASSAAKAASARQKIRESWDTMGKPFEDWPEDLKAEYEMYGEQVKQYRKLTGQSVQEQEKPRVKSAASWFGK
jgi:hypothetical protein